MQIKVKDTRMQWIVTPHQGNTHHKNMLVAESKLVLVDTGTDGDYPDYSRQIIGINHRWVRPIIISETEKIEERDKDWYYVKDVNNYYSTSTHSIKLFHGKHFKVLALPEHFSPKHLQAIVDGKMKDGDKVLVECEKYIDPNKTPLQKRIKLNPHITLHKVEEKMYTKEEVIDILDDFNHYLHKEGLVKYPAKEWFEQNVK